MIETLATLRVAEYSGDEDVGVWLEELNDYCSPVIFSLWPDTYPEHLAVFLSRDGELGVALTADAMIAAMRADRLWFCAIPKIDFIDGTDAEESWFTGGNDAPSSRREPPQSP